MLRLDLDRPVARRLADFCAGGRGLNAETDHWRHYGAMNRVRCDADAGSVVLDAGAGFDGEYELNFRNRSLREFAGVTLRRLLGRSAAAAYCRAFEASGGTSPFLEKVMATLGPPLQPHKLLAAHYLDMLTRHAALTRVQSYLEIGPGSGYLAALVHASTGCRLTLVDLPEMLPFSFLFLHKRFPQASFRLPGEAAAPAVFTFLTPEQLDDVPARSVDLAANTASFGEMLPEQVRRYFAFLRRVAAPDGLFFTVNREEKIMTRAERGGEKIPVRFDDYPWAAGDRDLLHARSHFHDLVQPGNTMRMRLCHLGEA